MSDEQTTKQTEQVIIPKNKHIICQDTSLCVLYDIYIKRQLVFQK